ncbi:hypothetical protein NKH89_12560 [Mesorhizobium sp. M0923]|uniref:hypothetical protein n=1 Tax=unclassified Mesorhizobium TaxID=325217 RepID=UPI001FD95999|nr:hypothetical protein [Mesorhizobium sp. L48C026A00]
MTEVFRFRLDQPAIAFLRRHAYARIPAAGFTYEKRLGRTECVPVRITGLDESGRPLLEMLGRESSASLMAMSLADAIAMLPPDVVSIEGGLLLSLESLSSN